MKSKYQVILDDMTTLIENGAYRPGDMLPTEKELTEQYSVSRTTVQRTLNILVDRGMISRTAGKGTFVAERDAAVSPASHSGEPGPREVAPERADELDALDSPRLGPRDAVMILPNHQAHVSLSYLRGAEAILKPQGWNVITFYSRNRNENVWAFVEKLERSGCGGFIIYPITSDDGHGALLRAHRRGAPVVTIDKNIYGAPYSSVVSNNYMGGYAAASLFLDKGHDNLYFVSNLQRSDTLTERGQGFKDALDDRGLPLPDSHSLEFPADDAADVQKTLVAFLRGIQDSLPAAVFCASDMVATQVYRAAYPLNIHIPDRLSVIGFDNLDVARVICPPLTTIAQNFFEIGRQAAIALLRAKESGGQCVAKQYLPVKIVERESVADRTAPTAEPR
ncbi:MAG: substrate-binding domain-containing protein [Oscillospiraceae bacterium]|jgi:DNA-binding LacI/PurR family transcriptional regulator|nr:substrate-binding domain-containing protein [Oscillospiraceae bacterium]